MNGDDNGPVRLGKQFDSAQFVGFVEFKLQRGGSRQEIVRHLISKGMETHRADALIDRVQQRIWAEEEARKITFLNVLGAIFGGLLGGAASVVAWALAAKFLGQELGYLAVLGGPMVAAGALMAGKKGGIPIQIIGLVLALPAVLAGEYLTKNALEGCRILVAELDVIMNNVSCASTSMADFIVPDLPFAGVGIVVCLWLLRRRKPQKIT